MANYRFKTAEIEAMKKNILTHIEREAETKTAWRLRCAIEGQLMCCRPSKREAARLERELALYERLTKNDLPNWQSNPTQPAQHTEAPRIVRVEIVRDFDKSYYANLYGENGGCHNLSKEYTDFRTLKTLCKKEYGVNLPNLSQIEFETHGRKSYAYISTETPQISTGTAEPVNASVEGEKEAETKETPRCECPNYADYAFERGWSIENTDFDAHSGVLCMIHFDPTDEKYVCGCLWQINSDSPNYTEHRRFKTLKGAQNYGTKRMGMKLKYQTLTVHCPTTPIEPSQSPETLQTVEYTADVSKPREAARKPQNRGIGNTRHSRLGANGYAMLGNASAILTAMHVPRECSTADYW